MRTNYGGARRNRLEGTNVGHWSVLEYCGGFQYRCRCVCGVEKLVPSKSLNQKQSRSCGCKTAEMAEERKGQALKKRAFKAPEKFE